ncbi:hypothetical protein C5F52_08145 [Limnohabitans sp. TS-CS-82]|nr:hypothetical protein C5F52_08145 [Limnohabitans sp. TS-CS-82]
MTAREFSEDGVSKIVLKSGQIRFEARINRSGEKSIQKRFTKKSTAIAWREEQLKTLARGAPITNGKKFTIDSVIDEYLAYRDTTMREQEITLAKFSDIRNHGFDLIIPKLNSKTKIKRTIFLSTKARQIIASQKQTCPAGEDRIFHQFPSADAVCEAFISLRKRAKVKNFRFHDLRHEATSRMCEDESIKFEDILAMTGHKSLATFLGYMQMKNRSEELKKFLEEEECKKKI